MKPRTALLHAAFALVASIAAADPSGPLAKPSSLLAAEGRDSIPDVPDLQDVDSDAEASDTKMMAAAGGGGAAAMHGHGKFFQYGHHDGKDHYENGFRRGNEHHFHERHEKGAPKHGHFTTKVRWGDKHGGYGEHYWDYNHGGHHDGGDGGDGGGGEGSAPVPDILEHPDETRRPQFKRQSAFDQAGAASNSGSPGESPPPGRSRAYRKKYVRPSSTAAAPTHSVPRAKTTPRPQPYRQPPPPPTPAGPLPAKSAKSATFFTPDFPPGGMFQSAAAAAGLGPRTARQTPGQADGPTQQGVLAKAQAKGQPKGQQKVLSSGQAGGQGKQQAQGPGLPKGHGAAGPGQVAAALVRRLAFDPRTGRVHDEDTGQVFVLQPVS